MAQQWSLFQFRPNVCCMSSIGDLICVSCALLFSDGCSENRIGTTPIDRSAKFTLASSVSRLGVDSVPAAVFALRERGFRICFERAAREREPFNLLVHDEPLATVLDKLISCDPRYRWESNGTDVINILPVNSCTDWSFTLPLDQSLTFAEALSSSPVRERRIALSRLGVRRRHDVLDLPAPRTTSAIRFRSFLNAIVLQEQETVWSISGRGKQSYDLTFVSVSRSPVSKDGDVVSFKQRRFDDTAAKRRTELEEQLVALESLDATERAVKSSCIQLVFFLLEENAEEFIARVRPGVVRYGSESLDFACFREALGRHLARSDYREFRIRDVIDFNGVSLTIETDERVIVRVPVHTTFVRGKLHLPRSMVFVFERQSGGDWLVVEMTIDPTIPPTSRTEQR